MAANGIGLYGIAGPVRSLGARRLGGLMDYHKALQEESNINAYNSMGTRSAYQRGLQSTANNAINGETPQTSMRTAPETTGQFKSLVANRGLNYGPDPRYPAAQNFGQAKQPYTMGYSSEGIRLRTPLHTMGGPVGPYTPHDPDSPAQPFSPGNSGLTMPKYTEANSFRSSGPSGQTIGVTYDPNRGTIGLRGSVSTADWMKQTATTGPSAGMTNEQALQAMRDRANAREQDFRDGRVIYNAQKYGLPAAMPRVAAARQRSLLNYPGGSAGGLKALQDAHKAGLLKQRMEHNMAVQDKINEYKIGLATGKYVDISGTNEIIRKLEESMLPMDQIPGGTPGIVARPSSGSVPQSPPLAKGKGLTHPARSWGEWAAGIAPYFAGPPMGGYDR